MIKTLVDTLIYAFLSLSHVWMFLAFVLLLVKRRKFRANPRSVERRFYQGVIAVSMIAWMWNGLRPTPKLFEERAGLYWGIKTENAKWKLHTGGYRGQPAIASTGKTSMAVQFRKTQGWVIFHHFPTAPQLGRYEAVGFRLLRSDLKEDPLRLAIYSDGKVPHPSNGLVIDEHYRNAEQSEGSAWESFRVPVSDFGHPGGGLIGVAFGKADGVDEGTFYLDDVHMVEKQR